MSSAFSSISKKDWSVSEILKLIELYKNAPVLWDKETFSCKVTRDETLQNMATIFNTNPQSVNRKVHNLRTQYFDEVRKVERTKELRPQERFVPKWIYFNQLTFLTKKPKKDNQDPCQSSESDQFRFVKVESNGEIVNGKEPDSMRLPESYMLQMFHEPEETDFGETNDSCSEEQHSPTPTLPESPQNNTQVSTKRKASWQANEDDYADDYSIFGAFVASEMRGLRHESSKKKLKCSIMHAILNAIEEDREGGGARASNSHNSTAH